MTGVAATASVAPVDDVVLAELVEKPRPPWGGWATLGMAMSVFLTFVAIQSVVAVLAAMALVLAEPGTFEIDPKTIEKAASTGWIVAAATWTSWPVCLGLVALLIRLRRPWTVRDYLALRPVSWRQTTVWLLLAVLLVVVTDGLTWLLGRPVVPDFMREAYQTAGWLPLLWATVIVAAPLGEELFFRGFLFRGLQASRLGTVGAILIASSWWAAIHLQYDMFQIGILLAFGLFLGAARAKTESTLVHIAIHALMNLIATVEAHLSM